MERADPCSPPQVGDPRSPRATSPPHDEQVVQGRGGCRTPTARWHRSTAGTLARQEGSGAREDFADVVVLQDLVEI